MRAAFRRLPLVALLVAFLPAVSLGQAGALRVIRAAPNGTANPLSKITVTFDRPVAGSLDRTIDPATILRIAPAVAGTLEWRDPVTIRLTPSTALPPGRQYTVTIDNAFRAMDGSALAEPYKFSFRVQGPVLLAGNPVGPSGSSEYDHLVPAQKFSLAYSSPVDLTRLSADAFIELNAGCGGAQKIVRMTAASQRRIRDDDDGSFREAGGWQRDRALDSLRRVVLLAPQSPLPLDCGGELVVPAEIGGEMARFAFRTYGQFRMIAARCGEPGQTYCAAGPVNITFSNPVRGAEVQRRITLIPAAKFVVRDTSAESVTWTLDAKVALHTGYAVVADTAMRDVYGQSLRGNPALGFSTTGYEPTITYAYGRQLVERVGYRTLAVLHTNVDTLVATVAPIPPALEAKALGLGYRGADSLWAKLMPTATVQRIPVRANADHSMITGVRLPTINAMTPGAPTLFAVRVGGRTGKVVKPDGPTAILQVSDVGVHAKIGTREGVVWITGVSDGQAKAGALVTVHDATGRALASGRTDAQGLVRFTSLRAPARQPDAGEGDEEYGDSNFEGYVSATLGTDRGVAAINEWDADLSPYHFNVSSAWGDERIPVAGALFTERGIYRPGERVYAKAIVRDGSLGALRAPAAGDSVKWLFTGRENAVLREVTSPLSPFGTSDQSVELSSAAGVGQYGVSMDVRRQGKWRRLSTIYYRVAEYRPPEFLVDLSAPGQNHMPGDKLTATTSARYLFGAPMGRAQLSWLARLTSVYPWELGIPGMDDWSIGESGAWWEDFEESAERSQVFASKVDTLDATGTRAWTVTLPATPKGRAARVTVEATVTDVNRQVVGTSTTTLVHPAEFYIAARTAGDSWFWKAGTPQSIALVTVRPDGQKVTGVRVNGVVVLREWHRVRRERDGVSELVGDWVSDTVATCTATTSASSVPCNFTPKSGGEYSATFTAVDSKGHRAVTTFHRWASGEGWVPWSDETQFKMDVIPDKTRYAVGDTATIMFASPFVNAEAWITVEREGLIEQRRMRITSGSTTLKFPITEVHAPNVYVSILVARGRSAKPGYLDDLGRPTIRVGYAELKVTAEVKRLTVAVNAERPEYRPGDSARVRVHVRDAQGRGAKSEATLWAVDEGVLSLTGYKTPDPLTLIYRERGLGMRLASNMTAVAPQVPEGEKGWRNAGGGGGVAGADILRSRFQTTAFFLGSVVTDAQGNATAAVKLPDNITTFRVMAVAVTAADRYGKGQSEMLVTRPLLARQALPRFVRPADAFTAGAVINRRDGSAANVKVTASVNGATLRGDAERTATLAAQRGAEVRFPFVANRGDSVSFRFDVADASNADAVRVTIPVRPDHHPVVSTLAGVLRDSASLDLVLPPGVDLDRSRLSLSVGNSPLALIRGMQWQMRVYPYACTEQVTSSAMPILALFRAQRQRGGETVEGNPRREIARAVAIIASRQREDGGIGYWSATDWTSPWLTSYAGLFMLDARDAAPETKADTVVLNRIATYLTTALSGKATVAFSPVAYWSDKAEGRLRERLAAVDFLSRYGRPDVATENELLRTAAQLTYEDRARLAEVLARRKQMVPARRLMEATWSRIRVEGRRAVLPDSMTTDLFYFRSDIRPAARILQATLAIDPGHALVGPLSETLVRTSRAGGDGWMWNTQDYASAVNALAALDRVLRASGERTLRVRAGDRVILQGGTAAQGALRDSSIALAALGASDKSVHLSLDAGDGTAPVYYYLSVTEIPKAAPVNPGDHGIQVERWYERMSDGKPLTSVAEGELVRVRLRVTVPSTRYFVVLDDALPAGLEAVDLSLRTASAMPGPGVAQPEEEPDHAERERTEWFGRWDFGWWSPFDHHEIRDDRVVYAANQLWKGTYTATYIARATTPGVFIRPPAHAEEMYNPAVNGRSDGGTFTITAKAP